MRLENADGYRRQTPQPPDESTARYRFGAHHMDVNPIEGTFEISATPVGNQRYLMAT